MASDEVRLWHHEDTNCPPGAVSMMSDRNRIGCANGANCIKGHRTGGAARAVYYVRLQRDGETRPRGFYVCEPCGRALAHRHGVDLAEPPALLTDRLDARARIREATRG